MRSCQKCKCSRCRHAGFYLVMDLLLSTAVVAVLTVITAKLSNHLIPKTGNVRARWKDETYEDYEKYLKRKMKVDMFKTIVSDITGQRWLGVATAAVVLVGLGIAKVLIYNLD